MCTRVCLLISLVFVTISPPQPTGRSLFTFFMPAAVALMMVALDEMNSIVRALRTSITVELADIKDILLMDQSGDGEIDLSEYTMVSVST